MERSTHGSSLLIHLYLHFMNKYLPSILTVSLFAGSAASVAPANAQTIPTPTQQQHHIGHKPFDKDVMQHQMHAHMNDPSHPGKSGSPGIHGPNRGAEMLQHQADLFGISVSDLQSRLAQGKTFQRIAQDLGITPDQLHAKRLDLMKAHLQELVTSGKITQAQMDSLLQRMQNPLGTGHGGSGMHRNHETHGPSAPNAS